MTFLNKHHYYLLIAIIILIPLYRIRSIVAQGVAGQSPRCEWVYRAGVTPGFLHVTPRQDVLLAQTVTPQDVPQAHNGTSVLVGSASNEKSPDNLRGPRDVLEAFGITESFWERVVDGQPVQPGEEELLFRVLWHTRVFQPTDWEEWAQDLPDWSAMAAQAKSLRGEMFRITGWVTHVKSEEFPKELAERLGSKTYFVCDVESESGQSYTVYTRRIPRAWQPGLAMKAQTRIYGIFFKLVEEPTNRIQPVLITDRPAWFPDTLLGRLGMDCALLDDITLEATSQRFLSPSKTASEEEDPLEQFRLTGRDRECFYQLLAAVERSKPGELFEQAQKELARSGQTTFSVIPLFNDAPRQQGKLVLLMGTARRIEKVDVPDPDIRQRFGIDHYYTIYLFTEDSQDYPLVFCVRYLPPGVMPGEGPRFAVDLAVAGFFYKTWAFRSQRALSPEAPRDAWQLAPLLIGREAVRIESRIAQQTGSFMAWLVLITVGVIIVVIIVAIWLNKREEKLGRRVRELIEKAQADRDSHV